MSRKYKNINDRFNLYFGNDQAIGQFIQLQDNTFSEDPSEEGFIFEYDEVFGVTQNYIPNIDVSMITSMDMAKAAIDKFLNEN